ncbi:LacI family DNA-binding transcriptional regulator [Shouchella clausii]|uniref:LacI family DNA-binding transcriptional regulator n=1 Tax=Shouchella clausii TaxID=79880 RepID=UPI00289D8B3A|nr:LacI family DNA-binding transcriptional regulator [Shouchella clausii]
MKKKVTIRDIAKYAGVSSTTVSYVLNGINKMSEETKERVLQAIKELDYQPDFTAISLSKKRSNIIGVMIPTMNASHEPTLKVDQSYTEFIGGIESVLRQQGYDLLISGIRDTVDCKNWIQKRNLDGLIIFGLTPENFYEEMKSMDTPIVLIDNYEESTKHYSKVGIDDELGGYLATKHLIDRGHIRISFVGHDITNISVDLNRINGFIRALHEADLSVDENLIFDGKGSFLEAGYEMGMKILEIREKPTAIFASSDILAIGIIKALQEHGKEVPKDYAIVGFDNLPVSRYSSPSLTTISQVIFNKGAAAAQLILDMITRESLEPVNITLPIELIIRESTRAT